MMDRNFSSVVNTESRLNYLCSSLEDKLPALVNQLSTITTNFETHPLNSQSSNLRQIFIRCGSEISIASFVEVLSIVNQQAVLLIHAWLCEDTYKTNNNNNHIPLESKDAEELYRQGMELYWLQHFEKSLPLLEKAASKLYPPAFLRLAALYISTEGGYNQYKILTKSMIESKFCKDFFISKATGGNPEYENDLGWYYQYLENNIAESCHWHLKAAKQNYGPSMNTIGIFIETHKISREETPAYWYQKAADIGFSRGQANLALCYGHGEGVSNDVKKAMYWYQKAADQGHTYSMYAIGHFKETEDGNHSEALVWYHKAADALEDNGLFRLVKCYLYGELGMHVDIPTGMSLLKKSLDRNSSNGQHLMGKLCMKGKFVKRDYEMAASLFAKGAAKDRAVSVKCQYRLGICYYYGLGVKQNFEKAAQLFQTASDKQLGKATQKLARCYEYGEGVKQDIKKALMLYVGGNYTRLRQVVAVEKCEKEEQ